VTDDQPLADQPGARPVLAREVRYRGAKWDVVTDTVELDPDTRVRRDVVVHPGAVGVLALDDDRVLLLQQYRHPVEASLWELPAGLLDVVGEDPLDCARRELYEEAHLRADRWDVLVDVFSSPGMCNEAYRVYLARDLTAVPEADRHEQQDEERDMVVRWCPLGDAVAAVAAGDLHNAMAVVGLLAAQRARADGWRWLRPASAPWPERPRHPSTLLP
jgi:8-oxo-dGTP pyrophosphatase MutT (NUDIX family)